MGGLARYALGKFTPVRLGVHDEVAKLFFCVSGAADLALQLPSEFFQRFVTLLTNESHDFPNVGLGVPQSRQRFPQMAQYVEDASLRYLLLRDCKCSPTARWTPRHRGRPRCVSKRKSTVCLIKGAPAFCVGGGCECPWPATYASPPTTPASFSIPGRPPAPSPGHPGADAMTAKCVRLELNLVGPGNASYCFILIRARAACWTAPPRRSGSAW